MPSLRALAFMWLGSTCAQHFRGPDALALDGGVVEIVSYSGPRHGVGNGLALPPAPLPLRGTVPADLSGTWGGELTLDEAGHFLWQRHGCMGTTYWVGKVRRDGDVLIFVPDKPDWMFGAGRFVDVTTDDEGIALVVRPRTKDDRSHEFPLHRSAD